MQGRTSGHLHVIIPAGGAGTRLWPLSRRRRPKFLLDLTGSGLSLLQQTVVRLVPVALSYTIVTGPSHRVEVEQQVERLRELGGLPTDVPVRVVVEPAPRNSMPAIGLATALVRQEYGDQAVVGSFAADHQVQRPQDLLAVVHSAIETAELGYLSTIGIAPTAPSTAFGYIRPSVEKVSPVARRVVAFVEKPDAYLAEQLIKGGYLWNAGMFVVRVADLWADLFRVQPDLARDLQKVADHWGAAEQVGQLWDALPSIAIDHALAEPLAQQGRVAVVSAPVSLGWSDLGDFPSLPADTSSLVTEVEASGAVVRVPEGKRVVIFGVDDAVVVDTNDALLVTTTEHAQRLGVVVDQLEDSGLDTLL